MKIKAKPIEWNEIEPCNEWYSPVHGFLITFSPDDWPDKPYIATWGEGDEDMFKTLDEAKQWCQSTLDAWVKSIAVIVEE
jgi:hypothetical protein